MKNLYAFLTLLAVPLTAGALEMNISDSGGQYSYDKKVKNSSGNTSAIDAIINEISNCGGNSQIYYAGNCVRAPSCGSNFVMDFNGSAFACKTIAGGQNTVTTVPPSGGPSTPPTQPPVVDPTGTWVEKEVTRCMATGTIQYVAGHDIAGYRIGKKLMEWTCEGGNCTTPSPGPGRHKKCCYHPQSNMSYILTNNDSWCAPKGTVTPPPPATAPGNALSCPGGYVSSDGSKCMISCSAAGGFQDGNGGGCCGYFLNIPAGYTLDQPKLNDGNGSCSGGR